ncbi:hypothetical protein JN09_000274 [Acholeplasma morum]|jgi:hypothetical protein|uniref:DUF951 domain-containing protein n=1 Tax=Paracholeplasma morum TaxID=264637 RepID=UPI00280A75BB|nr:DUF951 domain-containing protein [Paracholeplasma morum]MBM7452955.1 hypothetical protein [Paracholeplasma morum]
MMTYKLKDLITTKKPHVCGSNTWEVVRIGADIKIKCTGCAREVMIPKYELDKKIKK